MLALFLFVTLGASAATPPRPKISEVFEGHAKVLFRNGSQVFHGEGRHAVDQPDGKAVEEFHFAIPRGFKIYELLRFDLRKEYIHENRRSQCFEHDLPALFPLVWGWLSTAKFEGFRRHGRFHLAVWNTTLTIKGVPVVQRLAVIDNGDVAPHRPVLFEREFNYGGHKEIRAIEYQQWFTHKPPAVIFDVPSFCKK